MSDRLQLFEPEAHDESRPTIGDGSYNAILRSVSTWGLAVMVLLLGVAATAMIRKRGGGVFDNASTMMYTVHVVTFSKCTF